MGSDPPSRSVSSVNPLDEHFEVEIGSAQAIKNLPNLYRKASYLQINRRESPAISSSVLTWVKINLLPEDKVKRHHQSIGK
ncbi:hypothetical protein H6G03_12045 [Planktothrix sp. FACHB-1375]|uniref:Uncharacterized protein n=2 Tax=Aerosakkonema funiforme TaxID=1246630 RepID=A0A926VFV3_9CYAN|nr:hypothetical protein [Aerosakkonema funiforme FACHB-1375]